MIWSPYKILVCSRLAPVRKGEQQLLELRVLRVQLEHRHPQDPAGLPGHDPAPALEDRGDVGEDDVEQDDVLIAGVGGLEAVVALVGLVVQLYGPAQAVEHAHLADVQD